ncbi:MAG: nucleoside triphosphate pyrophosphatase [Gemmatimonadota bacterium]
MTPRLVLASGSPRRRQMLEQLGLAFVVVPAPPAVEAPWDGATAPVVYARRTAAAKAAAVASSHPEALVLGADTIVVVEGDVLGKPADRRQAAAMLRRLSGRTHTVHTALAIRASGGREAQGVETTTVQFRDLSEADITAYCATGEPDDKAGAYAIQGCGATLVERLEGCYYNVLGFPVTLFLRLLTQVGHRYEFPGRIRTAGRGVSHEVA